MFCQRWLGMVARDPALNSSAVRVAVLLWDRFNIERGGAWPSIDTMAEEIAMDRSTVIRALHQLEARGWITVERGGRGKSNFYRPEFGNFAEGGAVLEREILRFCHWSAPRSLMS
jgi:DNA-binding transcriptional MocR family regulator